MSASQFPSSPSRDSFSPILERFSRLLTLQLKERCHGLTALFKQYNSKELKSIYPKLLEDIFGYNHHTGWGLSILQDSKHNLWHDVRLRTKDALQNDFKTVRDFLSPNGPLIDLVYILQADPSIRFDFSTVCLPGPTRDAIMQGTVPQFYSNKLSYLNPDRIQLDAFDFFMFNFAYFVVCPKQHHTVPDRSNWEHSVYTSLVEDYLRYFLPLEVRRIPPMPYTGSSPGYNQGGSSTQTRQSSRQQNQPSLLRNTNITLHRSPSLCQSDTHMESIAQENWRSEVIIQVLVEFWLNQNSLYYGEKTFTQQVRANVLPSEDHVRLVRMLVKHLHFFVNSAKPLIHSPYHQSEEPLEDFKRCVIPLMVQKKLYAFFRHGFDHWPLDSSFRLMLETWLSYIQPWRYTEQVLNDEKERPLTDRCKKFVSENLLFYTVIYQEYVQRALRQDLGAARNAQMLFRVAKVFGQADLRTTIEQAEQKSTDYTGTPLARMSSTQLNGGGSFITSSSSSNTSLLQQLADVERPSFRYRPLFGADTKQMMEQLFRSISHAKMTLHSLDHPSSKPRLGFFTWLWDLMGDDNADYIANRARVQNYLLYSENFFVKVFQMDQVMHLNTSVVWGTPSRIADLQTPDSSGGELTPLGRYQMANGLRQFNITYNGNPDLQPIRSYENKHLVRFLYKISSWLNKVFKEEIKDMYTKDGFSGLVAKHYFQPACDSSTTPTDRSPPVASMAHHDPRISLRFFGSYRTIFYLMILLVFLYMMDLSMFSAGFVLFVMLVLYGVAGACYQTIAKRYNHAHLH